MIDFNRRIAVLVLACILIVPSAFGLGVGTVNTFNTDTMDPFFNAEGWGTGGGVGMVAPTPSAWVPDGGPTGMGDGFLNLLASGASGLPPPAGSGGKLTATNFLDWFGNYGASGIGTISMDVQNFGTADVHLRLAIEALLFGPDPMDPMGPFIPIGLTDFASIMTEHVIAADGMWHHISFGILPADLEAPLTAFPGFPVGAIGTVAGALMSDVAFLRIFDAIVGPVPFPGPPVIGSLGIDNIEAIAAVPVPPAIIFLLSGIVGLWTRRRTAA